MYTILSESGGCDFYLLGTSLLYFFGIYRGRHKILGMKKVVTDDVSRNVGALGDGG